MTGPETILTRAGVDVKTGLANMMDDPAFYRTGLEIFLDTNRTRVPELRNAAGIDWERYTILAHSLKTDCRTLGFTQLGELAYGQELAGRRQNSDELPKLLAELKNLETALNAYLQKKK